jgi:DNA-binding transcriptional regulator YiaG
MPVLRRFGSVGVRMYADDHRPPHFHIVESDFHAPVRISDLTLIAGDAPERNRRGAGMGAGSSGNARPQVSGTQRARLTMPKKNLPRIVAVAADKKPLTLRIQWDRAEESRVDVSGLIETFRVYEPLRRSPNMFARVRVGEHGTDVVWSDEIDMPADTLWRLAQEQTGLTMSADAFKHWRERKAYTLDAAARALGVSRRMVAYYEQGAKPIPRVVALATRALELA